MNVKLLVGGICSGKSTYCKKLAQEGWIVVNDDAIVNAVHSDIYTLYNKNLKPLYKSIESHIFHTAIAMGLNVVIDRGLSNTIHSRKRWVALSGTLDVTIEAVVFELFDPEVHAKRRFDTDNRGHSYDYWLSVARRHYQDWQSPTLEEGFSYIEYKKWEK